MDFSIATGVMFNWLKSGIFWLIASGVLTLSAIGILWWQKYTKLKYNCFEIVEFGNGKCGFNHMKAGIFKAKSAFFNLWFYGNENYFKTSDGRRILDARTEDLHDIMGKKGFVCYRKPDDPKILVPIHKISMKNKEMVMDIAPADYRDASSAIIEDTVKETNNWVEKYLPYIMLAGIVIFFVISMILATQFFNRTIDKSTALLLDSARQAGSTIASNAP